MQSQVAGLAELTNRIDQISQLTKVIGQFRKICNLCLLLTTNVERPLCAVSYACVAGNYGNYGCVLRSTSFHLFSSSIQ